MGAGRSDSRAIRSRSSNGNVVSDVSALAMSVSEGKDELEKRPSGPDYNDEEDGLGVSDKVHHSTLDSPCTQRRQRPIRADRRTRTALR